MALINVLDSMNKANEHVQTELQDKLNRGECLTDAELDQYQLTEDDQKVLNAFTDSLDGKNVPGWNFIFNAGGCAVRDGSLCART